MYIAPTPMHSIPQLDNQYNLRDAALVLGQCTYAGGQSRDLQAESELQMAKCGYVEVLSKLD